MTEGSLRMIRSSWAVLAWPDSMARQSSTADEGISGILDGSEKRSKSAAWDGGRHSSESLLAGLLFTLESSENLSTIHRFLRVGVPRRRTARRHNPRL